MLEVDQALVKKQYPEALALLETVRQHFTEANATDRLDSVRRLVACTMAQQVLVEAGELDKKSLFADALAKIELAVQHFSDGGNDSEVSATRRYQARVQGDYILEALKPALERKEYDAAVAITQRATEAFAKSGDQAKISEISIGLDRVRARAIQDGDKIKAKASTTLQKLRDIEKSKELLAEAVKCYSWAGADLTAYGINAIQGDIEKEQARQKANLKWKVKNTPFQQIFTTSLTISLSLSFYSKVSLNH
jgi:hypothetical protein